MAASAICVAGFFITQFFSNHLVLLFVSDGSELFKNFTSRAIKAMTLLLPVAGFQIVSTNFFVVTGRPKTSIFLSMLRQCIALIPCIIIFGKIWGLWGIIYATPVSDGFAFLITGIMILFELRKLRGDLAVNPA